MDIDDEALQQFKHVARENQDKYINLQPIQRGGVLPPESRKALLSWGDGYSLCDYCMSGRLDEIEKPSVSRFLDYFARFVDMDASMPTGSCREAKRLVISQLAGRAPDGKKPVLVIDGLAHYSSLLAVESSGVEIVEVKHDGHPTFKVDVAGYSAAMDGVLDDSSKYLAGALLTHVDYLYGNVSDLSVVGRACNTRGVPFIVNGAYSVGVMPFSGKEAGADFVTCSGHKSMASSGPIGMLAFKEEYRELLFSGSRIETPWSHRRFPHKITSILGCPSVYGAPMITLMSSFPHVVKRTRPENWKEQVANARWLSTELEKIDGTVQLGKRPHDHCLVQYETPAFTNAALQAKKQGFFLYNELKRRGIIGVFPGMVKSMKLNTFGLAREQVEHVAASFHEIAREHGIHVS